MEFGIGAILDGKVSGITKFGAFVSLPEGRSGLVHISEIAHAYVSEVSDHLAEGQAVRVKVISVDEAGRINLSIKKAVPPPPRPAAPPRSGGFSPRNQAPKEPSSFEDRLKQFMQQSDSKLSEMRTAERRISRKGGKK